METVKEAAGREIQKEKNEEKEDTIKEVREKNEKKTGRGRGLYRREF